MLILSVSVWLHCHRNIFAQPAVISHNLQFKLAQTQVFYVSVQASYSFKKYCLMTYK